MAKAYSLDLRQRVFNLLAQGESKLFIEKTLDVATKTILKWQKHYEKTGSIDKIVPTTTRPRKVDYKKAKKFIENNPDKTLKEIGDAIGTKDALYVIKKLGITYKKTLPIRRTKGRFARRISKKKLNQIPKENLIYLDESGFDLNMKKEYGWKTKGQRLYDDKSGNRKNKRITVISAYSNQTKQLIAPMYFEGNTDTEIFNQWIEEFLIPALQPNQTVILDNAAFHKSQRTVDLINSANCQLLYLPPYSPDFNPIEQKWGHVKNSVKKIRNKFENFNECLDMALIGV